MFFFFKQKTAYEMRISDWSSDVCSSDLIPPKPSAVRRKAATFATKVASRMASRRRRVLPAPKSNTNPSPHPWQLGPASAGPFLFAHARASPEPLQCDRKSQRLNYSH